MPFRLSGSRAACSHVHAARARRVRAAPRRRGARSAHAVHNKRCLPPPVMRSLVLPALAACAAASADLTAALDSLTFLNSGTITAGLPYAYKGLEVFYLETENVTAPGGWGGPNPYPYLFSGSFVPPGACTTSSPPASATGPATTWTRRRWPLTTCRCAWRGAARSRRARRGFTRALRRRCL